MVDTPLLDLMLFAHAGPEVTPAMAGWLGQLSTVPAAAWTALVALLGYFFTSWWRRHEDLNRVLFDLSSAIDTRLYWMYRVAYCYERPQGRTSTLTQPERDEHLRVVWEKYYEALHHWNCHRGWYYLQIQRLMGRRMARRIWRYEGEDEAADCMDAWLATEHRRLRAFTSDHAPYSLDCAQEPSSMMVSLNALERRIFEWRDDFAYRSTPLFRRPLRRVLTRDGR